jgi:hypothetical protein
MVTSVTHHGRVYLYLHHIQGSSHMIDYAKPGPVERERNKRKGETNIKLVDFNYNPLNLFFSSIGLSCRLFIDCYDASTWPRLVHC